LHRHTCLKLSGLYEKRAAGRGLEVNLFPGEIPEDSLEVVMKEPPTAMICDKGLDPAKV
jgi:hypothetical protein